MGFVHEEIYSFTVPKYLFVCLAFSYDAFAQAIPYEGVPAIQTYIDNNNKFGFKYSNIIDVEPTTTLLCTGKVRLKLVLEFNSRIKTPDNTHPKLITKPLALLGMPILIQNQYRNGNWIRDGVQCLKIQQTGNSHYWGKSRKGE